MKSITQFLRSTRHALHGIATLAKAERNFRLQLFIGTIVLITQAVLPLEIWERIIVILLIAGVLVLELGNSVIERFADAVHPRIHPVVREVKDMMAGAVLIAAVTAAVIGFLIFWPHVYNLACAILALCTAVDV